MNCDAFENRILDCQENQLSGSERELVESHLAGCANCQAFARQLERLNAALSSQLKARALPADFDARLLHRIQIDTVVLSEAEREKCKLRMQLDFRTGQTRLRRSSLVFARWLDVLGCAAVAAVAGVVMLRFTPALTDFLNASVSGSPSQRLPLLLASCAFVLIVLAATLPRHIRRRWSVI